MDFVGFKDLNPMKMEANIHNLFEPPLCLILFDLCYCHSALGFRCICDTKHRGVTIIDTSFRHYGGVSTINVHLRLGY